MKVILYSNEVIPPKLRVDQHLYSHKDKVRIVFLPIVVDEETKCKHYEIVQRYYKELGIEEFIIRPSVENKRAINAYQKAGFRQIECSLEEQGLRYSAPDSDDCIVMIKRIGI